MKDGINSGRQQVYYNSKKLNSSITKLIENLLLEKPISKGYSIISEKTPDNILVFNTLVELFPNAKFIFIVRDPRGIINSFKNLKKRDLKNKQKRRLGFGEYFYEDLNKIYQSIRLGDEFLRMYSSQCQVVYYERLVSNPEHEIKKVCDFLDISYLPQMLNTYKKNDSSILIEKNGKEKNPFVTPLFDKRIQTSSLDIWKKELSKFEILIINYFFSKNKIDSLSHYNFSNPSNITRILLFEKKITYLLGLLIEKISKYN